jgi:CubicO group peptidase (beta-lactamase class C family)
MKNLISILKMTFCAPFFFFFTFCKAEVNKDSKSEFTLLALISQNCISINDCFDRFARTTDEGANFQIYSSTGVRVYARSSTLDYSTYKPIASGSKWVTAVTAMRAIDCVAGTSTASCGILTSCNTNGAITLSTTTSNALGWTGTKGDITLRQLLSFTSGLNAGGTSGAGQATCISTLPSGAGDTEKDACAISIRDTSTGTPGQFFQYNSNHMAIAMRMLEKKCNATWSQIFTAAIVTPLGWDSTQAVWKGNFQSTTVTDGSMSGAYGLTISSEHYIRMLSALLRNGTASNASGDVSGFLSTNSVSEILNDQYNGATIGYSQFAAFGYSWQYGLGNWRYCSTPSVPATCNTDLLSHSIGINGFYPFIDRNKGYYAILAVNNLGRKNSIALFPATANSLFFVETVRPYIHTLLGK